LITKIEIENFRSIEYLKLENLGSFNVFVGKNNSGKSTILKGIEFLHKMLNPSIITNVFNINDYNNRDLSKTIRIKGSFLLSSLQISELSNMIIEENPQISAILGDLNEYRYINVHTNCIHEDKGSEVVIFSYIEKISLTKQDGKPEEEKVLIAFEPNVIRELIDRSQKMQDLKEKIENLEEGNENIEVDIYRDIKEGGIGRPRIRARGIPNIVSELILSSKDFLDFKKRLTDRIVELKEEIQHLASSETNNEFRVFAGLTKIIPKHIYWIIEELSNIKLLHESERKQPISKKDAEMLLDLKVIRGGPDRLVQLQQTVLELLGVRLDAFRGSSAYSAEIDVDNHIVDMNGAGIKESLRLILDLEFNDPNIVLLEEPEVHLHFELERKIFKYLLNISNETQIFMTTHSTSFIDASHTNNVFLVKKSEGKTEVQPLENDELDLVTTELGINISSLLLSKVLVFVEGPTDEFVIRTYLEKFYPEISYSEIGIIQMKGIGNYKYYANAHALEVFNSVNLKTIFIIDADSRDEEEIKIMLEKHPKHSKLCVLPLRCIENFFLNSTVILKYIQKKLANSGRVNGIPEDAQEIEERKNLIIDNLKAETLRLFLEWKFLKPIYPSSYLDKTPIECEDDAVNFVRRGIEHGKDYLNITVESFDSMYREEVRKFNALWEERKMDIVPGDRVIDLICRHYGVRYKKTSIDVDLLTQALQKEDWDERLKKILDEIPNIFKTIEAQV
jgi:putative ATP-dependent endonuclease of the OLD family